MDLRGRPSAATKLPLAKNAKSAKEASMKTPFNLGDLCVFARDQILSLPKVTLPRQANLRSKTRIQQVPVQGRKDRRGQTILPLSLPSLSSLRSLRRGESKSRYAVPITSAPRFRGLLGRRIPNGPWLSARRLDPGAGLHVRDEGHVSPVGRSGRREARTPHR